MVAGLSGVAVALAANGSDSIPTKQPPLVIEQAVALAKHYGQGTVVKVGLERQGEHHLYEAKVVGERGEVRKLTIDAHTAGLLENQLVSR